MSRKAHGQIRRSQVITTYGPGALIDLPRHSAIVAGLDFWPTTTELDEVIDGRLTSKIERMTGVPAPRLYAPPPDTAVPGESPTGIRAWRFPEWFVVQEADRGDERLRSRRLVHRSALDEKFRLEGRPVVATRFVRACPRGHVADINWHRFVHGPDDACKRQLWLDEQGTSGDLADIRVRCECEKSRPMFEASMLELNPLETCTGERPWLGRNAREICGHPSRLLIRTASNAYFPHVVSTLSLPDHASAVEKAVQALWNYLLAVESAEDLAYEMKKPPVAKGLIGYSTAEILSAIARLRSGTVDERPVKVVELQAIMAAPEGFGDDVPIDPNFHARRLPGHLWRKSKSSEGIAAAVQLHSLREVMALVGFSRFEAITPDIHGEYDSDVERAQIATEPRWFPAVENRGEGIFVQLRADEVGRWLEREDVKRRLDSLVKGHARWVQVRAAKSKSGQQARPFPGGPYVLLHTLSHLLIQSLAMRCGYPASSIRERIYAEGPELGYGILLYTGSPDAEGTLGGLVQQARHLEDHLRQALRMGALCSNDPICAHHSPGKSLEGRWLHGAACHGCTLVAETSCEMRNDYLDRALVVPTVGVSGAAFFGGHA